ncbi:MAG: ABC transporter ATP-binding protein/permease [Rickettsiales bacterium]|jgi:ATP-binding cassette subfamily B protein|nr:ABC transporter ATP-binding protein/permease [Rickettsiales bacterium]
MQPQPISLLTFITTHLAKQKTSFGLLVLFSLMWSVEQVAFPYVIKMIIDTLTGYQGDKADIYSVLATPLVIGASVWLISIAAWRLSDIADFFFSPRFQASVREAMTEHVFGHSQRYFSEHLSGSISNKIADMTRGTHYLTIQFARFLFPNLIAIILVAVVMATIAPVFAVILVSWALVHLWICAARSRICDAVSKEHSELKSELAGRIVDAVTNFITVRLFARAKDEMDYIRGFQHKEIKAHKRVLITVAKVRLLLEVPCLLMICVMIFFIIEGWKTGSIGTGDIAFLLGATMNLIYILWRVGMEFPALYREIGVCQQALSLISEPHEIIDQPTAYPLVVSKGEITFENVYFEYRPGQNLFRDKTLTIRAGEKVGLVGFSGSGKSTFVNLLLRLYEVERGRILIDGQAIAEVTQDSLRAAIALIPQDPVLFHRSLRENITYGRPEANEADMIRAAKDAHCHEFIMAAEGGYDAIVGERGVKLSGGQRQRVAIARAIIKNAPIVVFDEATSSLDSITELAIQQSMQAMMKGRTTIVIAHRLSTLTFMDRILVFDHGRIIEDGSHQALLAAGGHYARLWGMQAHGFLPDRAA